MAEWLSNAVMAVYMPLGLPSAVIDVFMPLWRDPPFHARGR